VRKPDCTEKPLVLPPDVQALAQGLYAGDLEVVLLTVLMAADENRVPCCQKAVDRIVSFLTRLSKYDAALPLDKPCRS
jgi:hypothetical protein